jgi:hypothetical protein
MSQILNGIGGADVTYPISVINGGTGATTTGDALVNLTAAGSGANADITSMDSLDSILSPILQVGLDPGSVLGFYGQAAVPQFPWIAQPAPEVNELAAAVAQVIIALESLGLVSNV